MNAAKKIILLGLFAGTNSLSLAATIDFNTVPSWVNGNFTSAGYNFNLSGSAAVIYDHQYCSPNCPVNGTMLALAPLNSEFNPAVLTMSKTGGGTFTLTGFDGTGAFNFNEWLRPEYIPNQIDVIGHLANGGTVTQSFAIDKSTLQGPLPLKTYSFNGNFTNLTSVTFTSSGSDDPVYNGFAIDNINIAAVPEPQSYAMLLAGLGLLGWTRRRRAR